MVVVVSEMKNHAEVVQEEVRTVKAWASMRGLCGSSN